MSSSRAFRSLRPALDALGDDFDGTKRGFVDYLLLDADEKPLIVLEAKSERKEPLVGKEQARRYALRNSGLRATRVPAPRSPYPISMTARPTISPAASAP